ncbi:MAG: hypothetical protein EZS28_000959 [Streblomastix strix]|uniref:Uncharacterized protein n=1 Tax=Streblomastix strix TaxID=222440 RepID=A0A5J4X8W2_9EUKA|nr:MAG: hypothetical protein EZS28_000959 [Streblomastix strix]
MILNYVSVIAVANLGGFYYFLLYLMEVVIVEADFDVDYDVYGVILWTFKICRCRNLDGKIQLLSQCWTCKINKMRTSYQLQHESIQIHQNSIVSVIVTKDFSVEVFACVDAMSERLIVEEIDVDDRNKPRKIVQSGTLIQKLSRFKEKTIKSKDKIEVINRRFKKSNSYVPRLKQHI